MPEEHRLTISSSTHLTPDDIARHNFALVRRGFDAEEVRAYLEAIAMELRAIAQRERELLDQLADAEQRAAHPVLDEPTLTAALGQETARVLHSAHEVASDVVARAETEAERLVTEATGTAERLVTEATGTAEERLASTEARIAEQSAATDAAVAELKERTNQQVARAMDAVRHESEQLLAQAREECRAMVDEAQQLRARVLADLSKRRKVLHAQIEQLRAGRERLAETIHDVRRSVDGIASDLFTAEDDARLAAEVAGRELANRPDEGTPEEVAAALLAEEAEGPHAATQATTDEEADHATPAPPTVPVAQGAPGADDGPTGEHPGTPAVEVPPAAPPAATVPSAAVDEIFAKLRAAHEVPGATGATAPEDVPPSEMAEEGGDEPGPAGPPDLHPLVAKRDRMVQPIVTTLARRLKRTLQDSQNDLLDALRSGGSTWSVELLPEEIEQIDGVATAALPPLEEAAEAGYSFAGVRPGGGPDADAVAAVAHDLAIAIVGPLRRRLGNDDALAGADDAADETLIAEHVGSAYREWKGERIDRLAGDHVIAAFSAGSMAAIDGESSARLEWIAVAGSSDAPCPDCEDNGLGGPQPPGTDFPTGHARPPAHPGCRCLLGVSTS